MSYEIPKNLTKYAEEFLFGLSIKQFAYTGGFTLTSYFVYVGLQDLISKWIIGLILLPIIALGIFFVFLDLEGKIKGQLNLKKSLYKASYFDKKTNSFIDVDEIKDNLVTLKNGTLLGIIEAKPIDFFILSKQEKERVMNAYREWLKSVDYYVQVLSRSVKVDLTKWTTNVKKNSKEKRATKFAQWMEKEVEKSNVRNRIFYIVIPEKPKNKKKGFVEEIKSIFTGEYTTKRNQEEYEQAKKELKNNVNNCKETLEKCGMTIRRIKTDELLGLYSSYFKNQPKINKTILSPIMNLDPKIAQQQEKIMEQLKNEVKQIRYQGN